MPYRHYQLRIKVELGHTFAAVDRESNDSLVSVLDLELDFSRSDSADANVLNI